MQFPPFDISDNGVYKGVDRDLIDAVAKELGVKVSYLDLPWTSVLPGLEAKKFDLVIAPVTITKERMKHYAFSVPIADATAALMKRADDKSIAKPEDIAGKTVGGQKGTAQVAQFKAFAAKLPKPVEVKEYVDNNQSYADLAAGRIDASINSLPNLAYAAAQRSDSLRGRAAAVRPADLFLLGRPARRQVADRRGQRGDRQARRRRHDGEDPEDLVRPVDGSAHDRARAEDLTAPSLGRLRVACSAGEASLARLRERRREAPAAGSAAASSPARMRFSIFFHSFGYLTQAAGVTLALSLAGIALGFVIGTLGLRRAPLRQAVARTARRRLCQRVPRRAAAGAAAVHLLLPRRLRPRRSRARRRDRRA